MPSRALFIRSFEHGVFQLEICLQVVFNLDLVNCILLAHLGFIIKKNY